MSRSKIVYFGFCLILAVLIIWRYQVMELRIKSPYGRSPEGRNYELRDYNDSEEEITLIGRVVKEPDVRDTNTKLTIEVKTSRILVTVSRYPEYKYGDELKITGRLQTPDVFEDFNYKDYLIKDGIYSVVYYPKVELLSRGEYKNFISASYAGILFFKDKLRQSIYRSLSPPQSSILGAMLLGDKNRMSLELKEKLNIAGVRHVTAVSGMHVLILSTILMSFLLGLGFWKSQAFYISIIIIFLFIAMTGFQASGIRAGIMGGLFLLGQKIGRKSLSSRAIVMAAGVMLVVNPLLLFYDVGFQLSFLAAMGIIYLSPVFKKWLRFIPEIKFFNFRSILVMTFSAYIFTLPILIYNFGRISLAGPLTNVLILPFIYWIMIFGFIFSLAGMLFQPLAWILSWPVWFLLTYLVKIVDFFSKSWAAKTIENVHWLWLVIAYLILGFFAWQLNKGIINKYEQ